MSDQAEHYKEVAFGADAPEWGPAFWEEYDGFVNPFDTFAEAWDQFRNLRRTEIKALQQKMSEWAHSARRKRSEVTAGDPFDWTEYAENPKIRFFSNANSFFWHRSKAAEGLLRYMQDSGAPPQWEELTQEERLEALDPRELSDGAKKALRVTYDYLKDRKGRRDDLIDDLDKSDLWKRVKKRGQEKYDDFPENPGETIHSRLREKGVSPPDIRRYLEIAAPLIDGKSTD